MNIGIVQAEKDIFGSFELHLLAQLKQAEISAFVLRP
jgi:hypothetical protein